MVPDLGVELAEAIEAVDPAGIIAGAIAQDGVGRQVLAQPDHDLRQVYRSGLGGAFFREIEIGLMLGGHVMGACAASVYPAQRQTQSAWCGWASAAE